MPQALVPTDTPLSIIREHIPQKIDIDKIVKSIESHMIHGLELPIQAQDLIKLIKACIWAEALNYQLSYQQFSV